MAKTGWTVYILRCADGSLYTGVTRDVFRRVEEHNASGRLAARYTRARRPVVLVYRETVRTRSAACRREYRIKQMTRSDKLALVKRQVESPAWVRSRLPGRGDPSEVESAGAARPAARFR